MFKKVKKEEKKKKANFFFVPAGFEPVMSGTSRLTTVLNPLSHTMERQCGNFVSPRMTTFN